jgi:peptidoglycan/xylan/chitin deacetylase (PgdA/CDA1 family)
MICLTGDVHHMSLATNDQRYLVGKPSETQIAARYAALAAEHGLKLTLYVTGRTFVEEAHALKPLLENPFVEIGGHTYEGLPQRPLTAWWYRLRGQTPPSHGYSHGSRRRQRRDILRTREVLQRATGGPMLSWRSHGLVADANTYPLLAECGVRCISDEINDRKLAPERTAEGLISHPMNVIPDHDHLYHAHRDEAFVERAKARGYGADCFGNDSYTAEALAGRIRAQVQRVESAGGAATILMHPVCQYLADEFASAKDLFAFFAQFRSVWAREFSQGDANPGTEPAQAQT